MAGENEEFGPCGICTEQVDPYAAQIVRANGKFYHKECNVCVQCFRPFGPTSLMFSYKERSYCEHDFWQMYGPRCGFCSENIIGEAVAALGQKWHPDHFRCEMCEILLTGNSYAKKADRPLCQPCFKKLGKAPEKRKKCTQCSEELGANFLVVRGLRYHPWHFTCEAKNCESTLDHLAREKDSRLYCKVCYERIVALPTCAACRMVIEGRSQTALGKNWHPEHFVCRKCETPLVGAQFYEYRGAAYCKPHYLEVCGEVCAYCQCAVVGGSRIDAVNKLWCKDHFSCFACDKKLDRFIDIDLRMYCNDCFFELPEKVRKHLKALEENEKKYEKQKRKERDQFNAMHGAPAGGNKKVKK